MAHRLPSRRYAPVGRCIYCGAERYDATKRMLHEEHIVPLALNGNLILPEASCRKCEKVTHKPEESLLFHSAKAYRTQIRYRSRRKYPDKLPLPDVNGTRKTVMVPVEIYPQTFALFIWPLPRLLSGRAKNDQPPTDKLWIDFDRQAWIEKKLSERGIYSWGGIEISNEMVFRLVAKLAHAYTVAEVGLPNFRPLLLDYILRQEGDIQFLIGGTEEPELKTDMPYRLSHETRDIGGARYIVITVQVFADRLAPTFLAVSGSIPA